MIDTKAIRAAAEAATPGPWEAAGPSFGDQLPRFLNSVVTAEDEDGDWLDICGATGDNTDSDMTHIATANPATILELLNRLEAAEAQLAIYEKHGVTCQTFRHKLTGCAECNRDDAMESVNETNAALANSYLELLPKLEAAEKDAARYRAITADPYFDGYAWWTQDICIIKSDDQNKPPTKDQVDAAVDASMKEQK